MKKILIETSARHIHLTQEAVEILFGKGYTLTMKKELSQPGQFASNERVELVGPKKSLSNVSILGPARKENQVELSLTDARSIGISAPIRESGNVKGTPAIKIVGPAGEIEIPNGVIAAQRHIHMTPAEASDFNVTNGQIVNVQVHSENRSTIFGDVVIRVSPSYKLAMHVDTDEANAAGMNGEVFGEII